MGEWGVSDSRACFWGSFPSVGFSCSALMQWFLFYLIIYLLSFYLLEAYSFLLRDRKDKSGGEGSWGGNWKGRH